MLTKDGETIDRTTAAHKYGGDPMAEYLDYLTGVQGNADAETGDVESPVGYIARFGRNLVMTDSQGFVCRVRFDCVADAVKAFDATDAEYCAWADAEGY